VVTDIETHGVSHHAFQCALQRTRSELGENLSGDYPCPQYHGPAAGSSLFSLLKFPEQDCENPEQVRVLGPDFSGAVESVSELARGLPVDASVQGICLVSSSTTDSTNVNVSQASGNVHFVRLAVSDWEKLRDLAAPTSSFGIERHSENHGGVALLTEATTFGNASAIVRSLTTVRGQLRRRTAFRMMMPRFKLSAKVVCACFFPASIADIRWIG
jgi:hypothetical protein